MSKKQNTISASKKVVVPSKLHHIDIQSLEHSLQDLRSLKHSEVNTEMVRQCLAILAAQSGSPMIRETYGQLILNHINASELELVTLRSRIKEFRKKYGVIAP